MASFASSATTGGARKHAWTNWTLFDEDHIRWKITHLMETISNKKRHFLKVNFKAALTFPDP